VKKPIDGILHGIVFQGLNHDVSAHGIEWDVLQNRKFMEVDGMNIPASGIYWNLIGD
jgi:hypothetical protein